MTTSKTVRGWLDRPVKGLLLDISGVLRDGDEAIPGSLEAFQKLKESPIPVRLVTNETQVPVQTSLDKLTRLGFTGVTKNDIFAPAPAIARHIKEKGLRPYLLVHPKVMPEFEGVDTSNPNCVVVGDAAEHFTYERMNQAFRVVLEVKEQRGDKASEPVLFSLGRGKYYKEPEGLCLDLGPFTVGLEYATGVTAHTFGKPSPAFFHSAVNDLGLSPDEVVMIGDDVVGDVGGAQGAGLRGVLVRSGKYRPSDETHPTVTPDGVVDNLAEAMQLLLH